MPGNERRERPCPRRRPGLTLRCSARILEFWRALSKLREWEARMTAEAARATEATGVAEAAELADATEATVEQLTGKLGLAQKVGLLTGAMTWRAAPEPAVGLAPVAFSDGPAGIRGGHWDERLTSVLLPPPRSRRAGSSRWSRSWAPCWPPRAAARECTWCSPRRRTCTVRRWAAGTSSASPRVAADRPHRAAPDPRIPSTGESSGDRGIGRWPQVVTSRCVCGQGAFRW